MKVSVLVAVLGSIQFVAPFQPINPSTNLVLRTSPIVSTSALLGKKKKKGGGGGGGKNRGQQQQEKQSVKDARFDAATRQFMFTLVGLTKVLPDKSKKILDNIHLSFYPGAKIGIVGLNGSGKVRIVLVIASWSVLYSFNFCFEVYTFEDYGGSGA